MYLMIFRNDDISPAASPLEVTDHLEIDRYETRLVIVHKKTKFQIKLLN